MLADSIYHVWWSYGMYVCFWNVGLELPLYFLIRYFIINIECPVIKNFPAYCFPCAVDKERHKLCCTIYRYLVTKKSVYGPGIIQCVYWYQYPEYKQYSPGCLSINLNDENAECSCRMHTHVVCCELWCSRWTALGWHWAGLQHTLRTYRRDTPPTWPIWPAWDHKHMFNNNDVNRHLPGWTVIFIYYFFSISV